MVKYSAAEHESAKKKVETVKQMYRRAIMDLKTCEILKFLNQVETALKNGSTVTVKYRKNYYDVVSVAEPMVSEAIQLHPDMTADIFIRVTYLKAGVKETRLFNTMNIQIIPPSEK